MMEPFSFESRYALSAILSSLFAHFSISSSHIIIFQNKIRSERINSQKIAIIGAGIGSGACSYYLNKFGGISGVEVFESRDYIGGRINEIEFCGQIEEIGADAWSSVNYYVGEISKELGIDVENSTSNSTFSGNGLVGIWDGSFVDWEKLLVENPKVDLCISNQIETFIKHLSLNYFERQIVPPFTTINDFLKYANLTYYTETQFSLLIDQCNLSSEYEDVLIAPVVRAIYDQPLTIQSFGGEVSLVSVYTTAFWVSNGNSQLPKQMFNQSNANVYLNKEIKEITWTGEEFILISEENENYSANYIVIGAPIEKTGIQFNNITFNSPITARNFVNCFVTHVEATAVNPIFFGLNSGDVVPDIILTSPSSTLPFTSLQVEDPSLTTPGSKIYKLFSNSDITSDLKDIFLDVSSYHVQEWPYTFPELIPTDDFQPVLLANNIFYLNTIESAASAMEASIIAGRNTAQLIVNSISHS